MTNKDMNDKPPVFRKEKGIRHLFAALRYSVQGLQRLWQEAAFRHEVILLFVGLVLFAVIGAPFVHYLIFVILMLLMVAFEAINTAIEELVDRISPEISSVGRHAKDLGSLAVFCLILINAGFVLYAVIVNLFMG
jgi:diacylglycerol kinase (ATP)